MILFFTAFLFGSQQQPATLLQESVALQCAVESSADGDFDCDDFVEHCSRVLVQQEEEEYVLCKMH